MSLASPSSGGLGRDERDELRLGEKIVSLNWSLVLLVLLVAGIGVVVLYSAGDGSMSPWANSHLVRVIGCLALMVGIALIDVRVWMHLAYPIYFAAFGLLIAVEFIGSVGMGAQRWIDLGIMRLQPSEVMKVGLVLALARYFHSLSLDQVGRPTLLIAPVALVVAPAALVREQPDLGTALMLVAVGGTLFFVVGVRLWKFAVVIGCAAAAIPIIWPNLTGYQQSRITTFLDPESDPLGAGYNIIQSKIALGSGGLFGRGFLEGTQSHLNFLPEPQTDFIFPMLAEEFGFAGAIALLVLYGLIIVYGIAIGLLSRHQFGRILAIGLAVNLFFYVFINVGMVMGLLPVVGVPLPLVSYGGTAMLTVMIGLGLTMGVYIHRNTKIGRRFGEDGA